MIYTVENEALQVMLTDTGETVERISNKKGVLLVFLRHFGCQFCREALADLAALQPKLKSSNIELIFVHMGEPDVAEKYFQRFNLEGVISVSDPHCRFYEAFGLVKGAVNQIFALHAWFRGFSVQAKYGADVGKHLGDSFQMPGVFSVKEGQIVDAYIHKYASDRPDYLKLTSVCAV